MVRIMLLDLWNRFTKKINLVFFMLIAVGVRMAGNTFAGGIQKAGTFQETDRLFLARGSMGLGLLIILYGITQEIPLRLCKGMFLCAAGKKEKMEYLIGQFTVKVIASIVLLCGLLVLAAGGIFISGQPEAKAAQLMIWFFTVLNINMKVGIGIKGARKLDEKGYAIYSKAELSVNTNWFCLLLIQNAVLYTYAFMGIELAGFIISCFTGTFFLLNVIFTARFFLPVLREAMSYEDVYRQKPETEENKPL